MKNILACVQSSYGKYASTAYGHMAKIGITHVQIEMPPLEDVDKVRLQLARHGLSVASIEAECDISKDDVAENFILPAEIATKIGTTRIFVSVHRGDIKPDLAYQRLREIGQTAKKYGVIVILETHPDMVTNGDVGLQTMQGVNHPNIRINFDTANIYYYNKGLNVIEEMKKVLSYIEGVHLKDTNGEYHTWYFPALGEGIVSFKEIFQLLNERGFYGPFTMQIEGIQDESVTLEETYARMEKSMQHLRDLGCID